MADPTPENIARVFGRMSRADLDIVLAQMAHDRSAAEQRGFDRAVNETAILSIHKAVAAERDRIFAEFRSRFAPRALGVVPGALLMQSTVFRIIDEVEAGEHRKEQG